MPKGMTEVALGMSKTELQAARAGYLAEEKFTVPPGSMEMHGKDVALDRNSFWTGGKGGSLGQIWMWSERTHMTREQCFELGRNLVGIYGKPTYVFALKDGRDIGFRWLQDGKSVILLFRADPDIFPQANMWVDGPDRLALDGIPLYKLVEDGKLPFPKDLAGWLNQFLDRAFAKKRT